MKKVLLTALLAFAVLLPVHVFAHSDHDSGPQVSVTPAAVDFGQIVQSNGPVSVAVMIKNTGNEALELHKLSTSCGCTTAEMDLSDLKPGEEREMTITFDPMVHEDQFGEITRVVYLQTSDPDHPEIEIDVTGFVIKENNTVTIFFNEACKDCGQLVKEFYPGFFAEYGYKVELKDYINERENRAILNEYNRDWQVPFELQSHIEAFVGDGLLLGGHVPEGIMRYLLENPDEYERLVVFQDKMHGEETDYKVWDFAGEIKTYPIDEPITTYLGTDNSSDSTLKKGFWGLFALITSSAFLDGLNPCAFAVLLFFIAFLFSIKKTKASIWKMGVVYIFAIFLAYLLIGVGIAQAIVISGAPHLMAYIGSYLVIGLGVIQLLGVAFPQFPIRLRIPLDTKATLEKWMYKATLPASLIGGFLVGLCTFPCSGGIYVAIIGMLSVQQTMVQGLGWMVWYNLIFVLPLVIMLILASNKRTTQKLQKWERAQSKREKVIIGAFMVLLGAVIILFFT